MRIIYFVVTLPQRSDCFATVMTQSTAAPVESSRAGARLPPLLVLSLIVVGVLVTAERRAGTVHRRRQQLSRQRAGASPGPGDGREHRDLSPSPELLFFDPGPWFRVVSSTPVASTAPPLYAVLALPFSAIWMARPGRLEHPRLPCHCRSRLRVEPPRCRRRFDAVAGGVGVRPGRLRARVCARAVAAQHERRAVHRRAVRRRSSDRAHQPARRRDCRLCAWTGRRSALPECRLPRNRWRRHRVVVARPAAPGRVLPARQCVAPDGQFRHQPLPARFVEPNQQGQWIPGGADVRAPPRHRPRRGRHALGPARRLLRPSFAGRKRR